MNFWNVVQAQDKSAKATWLPTQRGGGRGKFTSSRKYSTDGKYLNTCVASVLYKAKKIKKKSKDKPKEDLDWEDKYDNFNF